MRKYFGNVAIAESNQTSNSFGNLVKSFITNKDTVSEESIAIKAETDQIMKIKGKHDEISIKAKDLINDKKT